MTAEGLRQLCERENLPGLRRELADQAPHEIAADLARLPPASMAIPFRLLDKTRALKVFEELDPYHQEQVLDGLRDHHVHELVEAMDPDDRTALVGEVPAKVAQRVLEGLSPHERR